MGKYYTILGNENWPDMISMRYNQVLENLGNMQIRRKYLLISTKQKTGYFEVRGYIDFGIMRIRDYTSQDPKVLIECHRHHGFVACPEGRPESLAYSPTRGTSQSPEFSPIGGSSGGRPERHEWPCCVPCLAHYRL